MKEQSPVGRIWELGAQEHSRLITAVVLAVIGVACGMVPYFAAAKIIVLLLAGEQAFTAYLPWLLTVLAGFLIRTLLYNSALSLSHKATFSILKTICQKLLAKLPHLPLGTVMDASSGKWKEIIVDRKHCGAGADSDRTVSSGLAAGAVVTGSVPHRISLYDDGHGQLCKGLCRCGQGHL